MSAPRKHSLAVGAVARDVASAYRAHWFFLVTMAVVVLLPQALADAFLDHLNVEGIHSARDVPPSSPSRSRSSSTSSDRPSTRDWPPPL